MKTAYSFLTFLLSGCATFGSNPSDEDKEKFSQSKQFDPEKGEFRNRQQAVIDEMQKKVMSFDMIRKWFAGGTDRVPAEPLPEVKPDLAAFMEPSERIKVIWFGHSTFLLNLDGHIVLVDPVFSESASPLSSLVPRFQPPVLSLEELPPVDTIVISHDHYDHLDMTSVQFFAERPVEFLVPLGVGSHLRSWGISADKIMERDWWQSYQRKGVTFTATPAQHFSGRGLKRNETLWASWVIRSEKHNIYFSGDSGYDVHFKEIGNRFGPFDLAFLETGQYNELWQEVHMLPDEGIKAFKELRAERYFPVHWGMFELSIHTWFEPIEKIHGLAQQAGVTLLAPKFGEVIAVGQNDQVDPWWTRVSRQLQVDRARREAKAEWVER